MGQGEVGPPADRDGVPEPGEGPGGPGEDGREV